jgi:hypothetical protein
MDPLWTKARPAPALVRGEHAMHVEVSARFLPTKVVFAAVFTLA